VRVPNRKLAVALFVAVLTACGTPPIADGSLTLTAHAPRQQLHRESEPSALAFADSAIALQRWFVGVGTAAWIRGVHQAEVAAAATEGARLSNATGENIVPVAVAASPNTIGEGVPCDGPHVPCWRVNIESRGTWNAYNPTGCGGNGCYGPYQFSGAWAGKLGLPSDLTTTTPAQWVAAADALWANGAGCSNWSAC
jgi:hypothetical protein